MSKSSIKTKRFYVVDKEVLKEIVNQLAEDRVYQVTVTRGEVEGGGQYTCIEIVDMGEAVNTATVRSIMFSFTS